MTSDKAAHSYRVEAVRSGDWWSITVPELSGMPAASASLSWERPRCLRRARTR